MGAVARIGPDRIMHSSYSSESCIIRRETVA